MLLAVHCFFMKIIQCLPLNEAALVFSACHKLLKASAVKERLCAIFVVIYLFTISVKSVTLQLVLVKICLLTQEETV